MEEYVTALNGIVSTLVDEDAVAGVLLELFAASALSYTDVADASGVSRSMVWDVMHGKKMPSVRVWACIAKAITDDVLEID